MPLLVLERSANLESARASSPPISDPAGGGKTIEKPVSTLSLCYDRRMTSNMLSKVNDEPDEFLRKRQWREPSPRPARSSKKNKKKKKNLK